jgi:hypothetical protein
MTLSRRNLLAALPCLPLAAHAAPRDPAPQSFQFQASAPPFDSIAEPDSGRVLLDGFTLVLLEYMRRTGETSFAPRQMLRDFRQHLDGAWNNFEMPKGLAQWTLPLVPDAKDLNRTARTLLDSSDLRRRVASEEQWVMLVEKRAELLSSAERFLLPDRRNAIGEYDTSRGGFVLQPELQYNFGGGGRNGRLFRPLDLSGHYYSALEFPRLRLPGQDLRSGQLQRAVLPVPDLDLAQRVLGEHGLLVFYELSIAPGIQVLRRAGARAQGGPLTSRMQADLHGIVAAKPDGEVMLAGALARTVRL